jgi:type IV pilus assembly protein PilV
MKTFRGLPRSARSQAGVMLLEALVAILIFSIGVIALMGLQATSISSMTQNKYRTDASYLANQIIAAMWVGQADAAQSGLPAFATSGGNAVRAAWDSLVKASLPLGKGVITWNAATHQATVTVTWQRPDDPTPHQYVATATIVPS